MTHYSLPTAGIWGCLAISRGVASLIPVFKINPWIGSRTDIVGCAFAFSGDCSGQAFACALAFADGDPAPTAVFCLGNILFGFVVSVWKRRELGRGSASLGLR